LIKDRGAAHENIVTCKPALCTPAASKCTLPIFQEPHPGPEEQSRSSNIASAQNRLAFGGPSNAMEMSASVMLPEPWGVGAHAAPFEETWSPLFSPLQSTLQYPRFWTTMARPVSCLMPPGMHTTGSPWILRPRSEDKIGFVQGSGRELNLVGVDVGPGNGASCV
jgi:hypothetical protein